MIYKILTDTEWAAAKAVGEFTGSAVDLEDGFIHFSSAEQVLETAAKHFAGQDDLVLLGVEESSLGTELKWEVSRGGDLFPHFYSNLSVDQVSIVKPFPLDETGAHQWPFD